MLEFECKRSLSVEQKIDFDSVAKSESLKILTPYFQLHRAILLVVGISLDKMPESLALKRSVANWSVPTIPLPSYFSDILPVRWGESLSVLYNPSECNRGASA